MPHSFPTRRSSDLSSVPPADGGDPVLARYGATLQEHRGWVGYLSSTGVYGDVGGAWVDESAAVGTGRRGARAGADAARSEEHTSELQSLMRISYAVFCLKKKKIREASKNTTYNIKVLQYYYNHIQ